MASRFNVIFPSKGRIGLDGGINTKIDKQLLLDNESPNCQNVIFGNGSVETRGGTTQLNTAAVGSFVCDGLYTKRSSDNTETMVGWWDGTLYTLDTTSFNSVTSAKCIFTAGVRVHAAEYEDYMFFTNGTTTPYKYKDSEFTRMSVPAPDSGPVAASGGSAADLSGVYSYKLTFVNSNLVESDVSPVGNTITINNEVIDLTSLAVAPASFGIESRRLYRTDDSGSTYKRIATISDNTTTTYIDEITSAAAGVDAPTDQGEIAGTATAILYHQGRIFYIDSSDNLVKYSEIGNPYVYKATSFLRIGDTSGDVPQTLGIHDNSIVVGCKRSTWVIYMPDTTASNWIQLRIKTAYGSKSPFGMFNYMNRLMMPAMENDNFVGFASISGQTIEPTATLMTISATGSDLQSNVIEPDMFKVIESVVGRISATVFQNKAYITLTYNEGTTNNRIYVFDFSIANLGKKQKFSWAPWTGLNAEQMTVYENVLYYADANATGLVYSMNDETYNDNGTAIDSFYWSKDFGGRPGDENFVKDWRWAHVLYEQVGDWDFQMRFVIDSTGGVGDSTTLDADPGASIWGTMRWGEDVWSPGGEETEKKVSLGGLSPAKRIQFQWNNMNTANQYFKVIGLNLDYNIRGRR